MYKKLGLALGTFFVSLAGGLFIFTSIASAVNPIAYELPNGEYRVGNTIYKHCDQTINACNVELEFTGSSPPYTFKTNPNLGPIYWPIGQAVNHPGTDTCQDFSNAVVPKGYTFLSINGKNQAYIYTYAGQGNPIILGGGNRGSAGVYSCFYKGNGNAGLGTRLTLNTSSKTGGGPASGASGAYLNASTIQLTSGAGTYDKKVFVDGKLDSNYSYFLNDNSNNLQGTCQPYIGPYKGGWALYLTNSSVPRGTSCDSNTAQKNSYYPAYTLSLDTKYRNDFYAWSSKTAISSVYPPINGSGNTPSTFSYSGTKGIYNDSCGQITTSGTPGQSATGSFKNISLSGSSCAVDPAQYSLNDSSISIAPYNSAASVTFQGANTNPPSGNSPQGNGSSSPSCSSSNEGLNWAVCGILQQVQGAEQSILEHVLDPLLKTNPIPLNNCTATGPNSKNCSSSDIYTIWSSVRVYGDVLLLIALLIIVFAESIGGGVIDAYTAKKMVPRILIAAILINVSIYLGAAAVDVTNILGKGIEALITAPLQGTGHNYITFGGAGGGLIAAVTAIGITGGIFAVVSGGWAGLGLLALVVILPFLLACLAVIATLIIRLALIQILVIFSPIAFALYTLPNTEKYFKKWWDLLLKSLLIYPIVGVLFGAANLTAAVVSNVGQSATLQDLLVVGALTLPLFMIPYAFKFAGGVLGTIHDTLQRGRKQAHQGIMGDAKNPNSLRAKLGSRKRLNQASSRVGLQNMANNVRYGTEAARSIREARTQEMVGHLLENNALFKEHARDENFLQAIANPESAKTKLEDEKNELGRLRRQEAAGTISAEDRARIPGLTQSIARREAGIKAANTVKDMPGIRSIATKSWAATGYDFSNGVKGYNELAAAAAAAVGGHVKYDNHGNAVGIQEEHLQNSYGELMDASQAALKQAGRGDLGGINHGAGYDSKSGFSKLSAMEQGRQKKQAYQSMAETVFGTQLNAKDGSTAGVDQLTADLTAHYNSGGISGADLVQYHESLLKARNDPVSGNSPEIQKQIEAINNFANARAAAPGVGFAVNSNGEATGGANQNDVSRQIINQNQMYRPRQLTPEEIDFYNQQQGGPGQPGQPGQPGP